MNIRQENQREPLEAKQGRMASNEVWCVAIENGSVPFQSSRKTQFCVHYLYTILFVHLSQLLNEYPE